MSTITEPDAMPNAELDGLPWELDGGVLPHWSGGAPFLGASDRSAEVFDPATGRVTKRVALASREDAEAVIANAAVHRRRCPRGGCRVRHWASRRVR